MQRSTFQAPGLSMCSSDEVAGAGDGTPTSRSPSEAQRSAFWAGITANLDAARATARKIVPRQSVEDVVNSAALRFLESLLHPEKPKPFPKSENVLRASYLVIVRNLAFDCVRNRVARRVAAALPVHSHWAEALGPIVPDSCVPDRELGWVFAHNDRVVRAALAPAERRRQEALDELHGILCDHMDELTPTQYVVIDQSFLKGRTREEIASALGITLSTYDKHRQAALTAMRISMMEVVEISAGYDRPYWYDVIAVLSERYAARQRRRTLGKKGERSRLQHERFTSRGERSAVTLASGTGAGEGATSAASPAEL